jgi:hypothetical protein
MSESTSFFLGMTIGAITAAVVVVYAVAVCLDGPVRR